MGVRLKLVGNRGLYKEGKCVYLCNHRAWADFFVDVYITEVRPAGCSTALHRTCQLDRPEDEVPSTDAPPFCHVQRVQGRAFVLSRYLVVYIFPIFAVPAMAIGAVFAFQRNKPGAHEDLNKQLDTHLASHADFSGFVAGAYTRPLFSSTSAPSV